MLFRSSSTVHRRCVLPAAPSLVNSHVTGNVSNSSWDKLSNWLFNPVKAASAKYRFNLWWVEEKLLSDQESILKMQNWYWVESKSVLKPECLTFFALRLHSTKKCIFKHNCKTTQIQSDGCNFLSAVTGRAVVSKVSSDQRAVVSSGGVILTGGANLLKHQI